MASKRNPSILYLITGIMFMLIWGGTIPPQPDSNAQSVTPWDDNSKIEYREPPIEQIRQYQNNPAYNYDRENERPGLLQRILAWIWQEILSGMQGQGGTIKYLLLGLVIVVSLFFVLKLLNIPFGGFFNYMRKGDLSEIHLMKTDETHNEKELEHLFKLYKNNKAYREAVRILYLLYLKSLEKRSCITIRTWKTNKDYLYEIKDQSIQQTFRKIIKLYEYVWFGQFDPDSERFTKIEKTIKEGMASVA
ncbi:DUF4129 domain-containing protein [Alkalitalea saponilacus]|nr:hypothetical protein [Alkalitalea saponilacus]ASB48870.1 hypothetical protein CDL62_06845 [Alkalitalea saponilacus]